MSSLKRAKFLVAACLICIAAAISASPALADAKRVALVIGNNDYENVPKLQKAVNDADAVARNFPSSVSMWSRRRMSGRKP